MTRRDLVLLGLSSAVAPLTLPSTGHGSWNPIPRIDANPGTIYVYLWGRKDERGIFALDPQRKQWTKVAGQSDSSSFDTDFRVSHDGRLLAFVRREKRDSIDSVAAGVSIRDLTRGGTLRRLDSVAGNPVWSADAKRLLVAVSKGKDPATKLFRMETRVVDIDGTGSSTLAIPETDDVKDWSPDGLWILTISRRDAGAGYQVYRMKLDGTDARRLTSTGRGVINIEGRISPDGRRIAYFRVGDDQSGIWVMDADGTNPRRIFVWTPDAYPGGPSWSPDGRKIAISAHAKRKNKEGNEIHANQRLILLDVAGGDPMEIAPPGLEILGNPQWAAFWKA